MRSVRRSVLLVLAVGLLVGAASCSSTSSTSSTGTTVGSTPGSAGSGGKVIKIGVIAPLDKGLTDFGRGIRNSVQLAVDQANARNAVPGHTLQVEAVDDSSDPVVGEAAAKKLAADPAVIAVVGPYNSGVAAKAAPVLSAAGITIISPSNTNPTLTLGDDPTKPKRPNATYFRMVGNDIQQAQFLAHEATTKVGRTSVAVVSETKAVSKGLADNFAADLGAAGGTVTVKMVVPDEATDFKEFIDAAKPTNPTMIFFGGEYPVAAKLRAQATAAGLTVPIMGGDGMKDDAYLEAAGAAAKGDMASSVGAPLASLASAQDFLAAYAAAKFPEPPTDYGTYSYDAANLVITSAAKAVQAAGVDATARKAVVADVQSAKTTGASGTIAFDQYGDTTEAVFTLYVGRGDGAALVWEPLVTDTARPTGAAGTTPPGTTR